MFVRALQGKEKALGRDHMSTLNTVNNLGGLYKDQGRLDDAEAMYERALQGYEKALGPERVNCYVPALITIQNLADLYVTVKRPGGSRDGHASRTLKSSSEASDYSDDVKLQPLHLAVRSHSAGITKEPDDSKDR